MRAQIQAAHELPYRLPGARRPSLETVHVRQDLGTKVEEASESRPTPVLDDHGQVPWHVRMRAARDLAKWSELCLAEARELSRQL